MHPPSVCAVVLSFNSISTLEGVLGAVRAQTVPVQEILVVDNASTDGTVERIRDRFPEVHLLTEETNLGVGHGHNRGWRTALARGHDLIWSLEHDCVPEPDCLRFLLEARIQATDPDRVGAVAPLQAPGDPEASSQSWVWRGWRFTRTTLPEHYPDVFEARGMTFNGTLIPATTVERVGWLDESFFLGHEDFELSGRIRAAGLRILKSPFAIVRHDLLRSYRELSLLGWKVLLPQTSVVRDYYSRRNEISLRSRRSSRWRMGLRLVPRVLAKALGILLLFDQKIRRLAALWHSVRDGLAGDLGRKDYRFLQDRSVRDAHLGPPPWKP